MKVKAIFWTNDHKTDIKEYLSEEIGDLVSIQHAKSQKHLLDTIERDRDINIVLTIINVNDIASLYQIQQVQQRYQEMPIIAIFDNGSRAILEDSAERLITMLHHHLIVSTEARSAAPLSADAAATNFKPTMEDEVVEAPVKLTKRQVDVLKLLIHGKSNKQIARDLHLSEGTVKIHCMAIFKEIGVANRTQAALRAEVLMHQGAIAH